MRTSSASLLTFAALLAVTAMARGDERPPAQVYTALDDEATQLREDFNSAKGSVRLLFVVDPICPGCLRGLDDMDKALLRKSADPRLQTFVVHVPYLGAKAKDVAPATQLLHNANVHHYWNESGAFGRKLSTALGLKNGEKQVYAWDVWLVYGPEATWGDSGPPQPQLFMHQLWALDGTQFRKLDTKAFARDVQARLASIAPLATIH